MAVRRFSSLLLLPVDLSQLQPILLLFLVFPFAIGADALNKADDSNELMLVQALWRHGDRAPLRTFKTDINQEDKWPQGWGQLTPRGMAQHVRLGKKLRERYVKKLKFISGHYDSHEVYVRSTDVNRTLISAISNMIGFYGKGADSEYPKELGPESWPGWFVPVAVHTIPGREDFIGPVGEADCPRYHQLMQLLRKTPEYEKELERHRGLLQFLEEKIGEKMDPFKIKKLSDVFSIEKLYKMELVDWANDTLIAEIEQLANQLRKWKNGIDLADFNGTSFRRELPLIRGGPILWKLIVNMQNKLNCEQRQNAVKEEHREIPGKESPIGTPLCQWINRMKYFAYSAHDTTLAALFAALGFPNTNLDQDGNPPYSACISVELWRKKSTGEFFVQVLYWRPEEKSHEDISARIVGCQQPNCSLDAFVHRSLPYQMLPSPADYCQLPLGPPQPNPPAPMNSTANSLWSVTTLFPYWLLPFISFLPTIACLLPKGF